MPEFNLPKTYDFKSVEQRIMHGGSNAVILSLQRSQSARIRSNQKTLCDLHSPAKCDR